MITNAKFEKWLDGTPPPIVIFVSSLAVILGVAILVEAILWVFYIGSLLAPPFQNLQHPK